MLIIIEGPDNAGKSTLADKLEQLIGEDQTVVLHKGPPKRMPLHEYEDLDYYSPGSGEHFVCDRWHLGELIYGPVLRGESRLTPQQFTHVELYLQKKGAVLVWLDIPAKTLNERMDKRGDDLVNKLQLSQVATLYPKVCRSSRLQQICVTSPDDQVIDWILAVADVTERRVAPLDHLNTYVGPPYPEVLLVGEQHGTGRIKEEYRPGAFVPYVGVCGEWLLQAVELTDIRQFGMLNAKQEENLYGAWERLHRPKVVALGREAEKVLRSAHVPCGVVPHPQYMKRFLHRNQREYASALERAANERIDITADNFR